jgi:WD40 repeat protein
MRARPLAVLALLLGACGSDDSGPPHCAAVACLERALGGHAQRVTSVAFSPDSRTLATGSTDFTARLWDVGAGTTLRVLQGHASSVLSVAFSPDGELLASGSEDATVRLWRTNDGSAVATLSDAAAGVTALAFSKDGRSLLGSSNDHTVRIWDVESGRQLLRLDAHVAPVTALCLSPGGLSFASAGGFLDGRVRLWSLPPASLLWQAFGETAVWSLAFAPDGRTLAAGGSFGSVRLRSAVDGAELRVLMAGDSFVAAVTFSTNGRLLLASEGSAIRAFDAGSGASMGLLTGHAGTVFALAVSPDGRYLASGSDDHTARLWRF